MTDLNTARAALDFLTDCALSGNVPDVEQTRVALNALSDLVAEASSPDEMIVVDTKVWPENVRTYEDAKRRVARYAYDALGQFNAYVIGRIILDLPPERAGQILHEATAYVGVPQ